MILATIDSNVLVGELGITALAFAGFWQLILWVRHAPVHPDPWDKEVEQQMESAQEICPHCSTPQPPTAWFCEHCGRAVGPYNNMMPYLQVFSEGEVLRNGTGDRLKKSPLITIGYFLISVNFLVIGIMQWIDSKPLALLILAGVVAYWSLILKNMKRSASREAESQPGPIS